MRRIYLIISVASILSFTSCVASIEYIDSEYISVFDYWYLQEQGIFVSESNNVNFSYTPVGSIVVEVRSGGTQSVKLFSNKQSGQSLNSIHRQARENILRRVHEELQALEANGIINVKVSILNPIPADKTSYYGPGYSISGMAIQK